MGGKNRGRGAKTQRGELVPDRRLRSKKKVGIIYLEIICLKI
jgi:hypothetical protein